MTPPARFPFFSLARVFTASTARRFLFLAAVAGAGTMLPAAAQQPVRFDTIALNVGINLIKAEVAASPAQREQGLMLRERMAPNEGMVFLFEAPAQVCMWMKNTLLPLSVAFIDGDGKIINIEDMQPQTLDSHCGKKPVRYALEMNLGWFQQKHIKPGATIDGLPKLR